MRTRAPTAESPGSASSSASCSARRSRCIQSSASIRAITGARQCSSPAPRLVTRPRGGWDTRVKRGSWRVAAFTRAPPPSTEPSSRAMHSQSDSVWRAMLARQAGRVGAASRKGSRIETRGNGVCEVSGRCRLSGRRSDSTMRRPRPRSPRARSGTRPAQAAGSCDRVSTRSGRPRGCSY